MRKNRSKFSPSMDRLEVREMLAGNVTASLSGGTVTITGDSLSNSIRITSPSLNVFRLVGQTSGGSATRINGSTGGSFQFTFQQITRDLVINMNSGDDSVSIRGNDAGDDDLDAGRSMLISTGSGNDSVSLQYLQANNGEVRVDLGSGSNSVSASDVVTATGFTVSTSLSGGARANLNNLTVGTTLNVDLGNLGDVVNISNSSTQNLTVRLYGADDKLSIRRTRVRRTSSLDGGSGNDDLNFFGNSPSTLTNTAFKSPTTRDITY